jgi:hypothetical protein
VKTSRWLLAIGCWLAPVAASALPDSTVGPWWVGIWGAAANDSKFDTRHGDRHRDVHMVGVRLGRQISASRRFALDYYVDIVPLIRSTNIPIAYRDEVVSCDALWCRVEEVMETATVRGYGVTPIGLQLRAFPGAPVELVFGLSAGAAMYDKPVPDPGEKRLNFMGDLTVGVQLRLGQSGALLAGIRHNHTSNAGTGRANPGLDTRVLYAGVTRAVGRRSKP